MSETIVETKSPELPPEPNPGVDLGVASAITAPTPTDWLMEPDQQAQDAEPAFDDSVGTEAVDDQAEGEPRLAEIAIGAGHTALVGDSVASEPAEAVEDRGIDGDAGESKKYIETLKEDSERGIAMLEWGEPDTEGYRTSTVAAIKTNLPPEFFTVNSQEQLYLSARSLDPLPPGSYDITSRWGSSEMTVTDVDGNKFVTAREIPNRTLEGDFPSIAQRQIIAGQKSNRVETFFGRLLDRDKSKTGVEIMRSYGFWEEETISTQAAATPETMEKIISEHDLPVKIVDSVGTDGGIPVEEFVESFAEGKLPIGPGDLAIYFHDVRSDDHMPGALIAGHEGMELVSIIAKAVIATGTQQEHGMFFDDFTAKIRHIAEIGGYIAEKSMERLCSSFDEVATAVGADVSSSQLSLVLARRFRQVGQEIDDRSMKSLADSLDPPVKTEKTEKTDDPYAIPF